MFAADVHQQQPGQQVRRWAVLSLVIDPWQPAGSQPLASLSLASNNGASAVTVVCCEASTKADALRKEAASKAEVSRALMDQSHLEEMYRVYVYLSSEDVKI